MNISALIQAIVLSFIVTLSFASDEESKINNLKGLEEIAQVRAAQLRGSAGDNTHRELGVTSVIIYVCSDNCEGIADDITQSSLLDQLGPRGEAMIVGGDACGQTCNPGQRNLESAAPNRLTIINIVSTILNEDEILELCQSTLPGTVSLNPPNE